MKGLVSKSRFESIDLIYPPLGKQHEFASKFDSLEQMRQALRRSCAELDALFSSLQSRAFRGELWHDKAKELAGEEAYEQWE